MSASGRQREVGCNLRLEVGADSQLVLQLAPAATSGRIVAERLTVTNASGSAVDVVGSTAEHGGRSHFVLAGAGTLDVAYQASLEAHVCPPVDVTEDEGMREDAVIALRPSRYCPSDALTGFAAFTFGEIVSAAETARAIASWVFEHLALAPISRATDSAIDTLLTGTGVCRDFAHLTIALCRARGVPARFASVYAPGLSPMDFHAVAEARTEHGWEVLDATRRAPRAALVRIATGRDAADAAFVTALRGEVEFLSLDVFASSDGDLPPDDHDAPVQLA